MPTKVVVAPATSTVITGLVNGQAYVVTVTARNAVGSGLSSTSVKVTPVGVSSAGTFARPFAGSSPWNTPIGNGATFAAVGGAQAQMLRGGGGYVNCDAFSHPMYQAAAGDTTFPVHINQSSGIAPSDTTYQIPAGATPALPGWNSGQYTDAHMHVCQPDGRFLHEGFRMRQLNAAGSFDGSWSNDYHVLTDLTGSGVGSGGVRAYGGSAVGGLVRTAEVNAGVINHVLALALPTSQMLTGPVWPATAEDGGGSSTYGNSPNGIHMGQLCCLLPQRVGGPSLASLGLTANGLIFATALATYGAYIVDTASQNAFYAEPTGLSGSQFVTDVRNDLSKIMANMTLITNNSPTSVGGGP